MILEEDIFDVPLHLDAPVLDNQQWFYISSVWTQDVDWRPTGSDEWHERMG